MNLRTADESTCPFGLGARHLPGLAAPLLILLAACTSMPTIAPAGTTSTSPASPPFVAASDASPDRSPEAPNPPAPPPDAREVRSTNAPPATLADEADEAIETTRRSVRSTAEWLARGVDRWFGDKPFEEGGKVTDGLMTVSLLKRQEEKPEFSLRFNARFRLPNVEQHTYLFLGRDDRSDVVTDKPGALSNQDRLLARTDEDPSFFAGLGRYLSDSVDLRLGFRGVKPYAQARYRHGWEFGERSLVEFRETLFWTVADHLGSTTALSWERAYTATLAARWVAAATITQEVDKFAWSSVLGGYKSFGERRLLSLEAVVSGLQGSGVGASDYGVQTRWSQPLPKKGLHGEVLVGQFWPRKDALTQRHRVWAVGGSLKLEF
jgi:hypothetical protein